MEMGGGGGLGRFGGADWLGLGLPFRRVPALLGGEGRPHERGFPRRLEVGGASRLEIPTGRLSDLYDRLLLAVCSGGLPALLRGRHVAAAGLPHRVSGLHGSHPVCGAGLDDVILPGNVRGHSRRVSHRGNDAGGPPGPDPLPAWLFIDNRSGMQRDPFHHGVADNEPSGRSSVFAFGMEARPAGHRGGPAGHSAQRLSRLRHR